MAERIVTAENNTSTRRTDRNIATAYFPLSPNEVTIRLKLIEELPWIYLKGRVEMARKKKESIAEQEFTLDTADESVEPEASSERKKAGKARKSREAGVAGQKGAFSPFALVISIVAIGAVVFSIFYRPISSSLVAPKINESLRINLSITSNEFNTEGSASGSLNICSGTADFPNINKATVFISDTNGKSLGSIEVGEASSKNASTCKYNLELKEVSDFPGTKLNVFVRFSFGDSNTFLVDVGSEPPYKKVNVRLTLG